jgi:hypothetical protein
MNKRPAHIEAAVKNLRQEAHQRVLERGLVQFRLDENYMQELLEIADGKGLGYGVLARMWLCERLEQEKQKNSTDNQESVISNIRSIVRQEIKAALKSPQQKKRAV